ncbi:hypothetical protein EMCRGX_G023233 [Ephydatia muelleri]
MLWAVVEEYEDDALASNSENEKRMEKEVREADRKVTKKRKLRDNKEAARKEAVRHELLPAFATTKPPFAPKITAGMVPKPLGTRFHCGELGHLRESVRRRWASVLYPLISVNEHGADESTCCGCAAEVGNVSLNGGETVGEVTPSFGTCGDVEGVADVGRFRMGTQRTALIEREFVDKAVYELLKGGYVEWAESPPVVCSPLSVVTNGVGKKRLVVNLRHVNGFLWKQKLKYEDLRVAMMLFEQGEWLHLMISPC